MEYCIRDAPHVGFSFSMTCKKEKILILLMLVTVIASFLVSFETHCMSTLLAYKMLCTHPLCQSCSDSRYSFFQVLTQKPNVRLVTAVCEETAVV